MNGKQIAVEGLDQPFELSVQLFKSAQERGASASAQGNSTLTSTSLFSKSFNNLFVKNFPAPKYTAEDLKVCIHFYGQERLIDMFPFRHFLNLLARLSAVSSLALIVTLKKKRKLSLMVAKEATTVSLTISRANSGTSHPK